MNLSIIVPPGQGGVRDFADVLASAMRYEHDVQVIPWQQDTGHEPVERLITADCVYLQYSGYGYAKRGAPLWLLRELQRNRHRIKRLGVFFHELYAFGSPWSSAFWLSPVQRHVARELAKLSDFWLTNREGSAHWLRRYAGNKPHAVLPVFSNVGEMSAYSPVRAPQIVVFGGAALREATYHVAGDALFKWARLHGLTIHDIGPTIGNAEMARQLAKKEVFLHGKLPADEVSQLLAKARYGALAYKSNELAKSGVFAAMGAHGVCPIIYANNYVASDGLRLKEYYLSGHKELDESTFTATNVGCSLWNWYQEHSIDRHLAVFASIAAR